MSGTLALDLSKRSTGWAVWAPGWQRPRYGSWTLGSEFTTDGGVFAKLHERMMELRAVMPFTSIYHEQAILPGNLGGNTNIKALNLAAGLAAHVQSFAHATGCIATAVNVGHWRKDFVGPEPVKDARAKARMLRQAGDDRASARKDLKALTRERCRQLGFTPQNDDEADAIGILDYALAFHEHVTAPWIAANPLRPALGGAA